MLAEQFDAFLIDLDGVVYVGADLLPGAGEALTRLRQLGRHVRFVTNDPRPTRAQIRDRLVGLGVHARGEEIVTSGWATARWLAEQGITRAHVAGSAGLAQELAGQGVDSASGQASQAVVVGSDESLGYRDVERAATLIRAGARFVATNLDPTFPTPGGPRPATGAVVVAVAAATGRRPVAVGKPAPLMFRLAQAGLPPTARTVVVSDSPASDVVGAHRAGLPAVLVTDAPAAAAGRHAPLATIPGLGGLHDPSITVAAGPVLTHPWPDAVRAGVAAVVLDGAGRVLLGRRADNGLWGLPCGHVEPGESVAEAVVREVREETGLHVEVSRLVGVYSEPASQVFAYPDGRVVQFVTASFACIPRGGRLRPDGAETTQVAFFPPDALPAELLPMHPRWLVDALSGRTGAIS